jgi:hypothetical protein
MPLPLRRWTEISDPRRETKEDGENVAMTYFVAGAQAKSCPQALRSQDLGLSRVLTSQSEMMSRVTNGWTKESGQRPVTYTIKVTKFEKRKK